MASFWRSLPRPFFVLAPMEDVTDTVFRQIVASCGRPEVMVTEFTSVEGLASEGHSKVVHRLQYTEEERPLVAQIWGITPENYYQAAQFAKTEGFDGLDINMGCPVKKVIKQGACSALIRDPQLAADIIQAAKEGAGDMPVSVKTRIGFNQIATEEWAGHLLNQDIEVLTLHGRTVKDMSNVPARWDEIGKAVELRDQMGKDTLIIGNGDIESRQQGLDMVEQYGVDGIMVGRGIFKNPWLFNPNMHPEDITLDMKLRMLVEHVQLFDQTWGSRKNFAIMKKFFKVYISGFAGASELRSDLVQLDTVEEILTRIQIFKETHDVSTL